MRIGKELNLIQTIMKEWFYTTAFCSIIVLMFFYGCILCLGQMYLSSNHRPKRNQHHQQQQRHWPQNLHGAMADELFHNYPNQSHGIIIGETDTEFDDFYGDDFEPDDEDSFHDSLSQISTMVKKNLGPEKIPVAETTKFQSKVDENKYLQTKNSTKEENRQLQTTDAKLVASSVDDGDDEKNKIGVRRIISGEFEPYEVFTGKSEGSD